MGWGKAEFLFRIPTYCSIQKLQMLPVYIVLVYLDHFLKGLQVLLHAVVGTQKGDEVARVHPVEAMEEGIDTGMEMDKVDFCHVA